MVTVRDLLANKPSVVVTTTPHATVFDALALMARHDIGGLPVLANGHLVGVFSERDYARGVALRGRSSRETAVGELMTRPVVVTASDSIQYCMGLMTHHRVRHLPVIERGSLVGIVTIGDVVKEVIRDQAMVIGELQNYIRGT